MKPEQQAWLMVFAAEYAAKAAVFHGHYHEATKQAAEAADDAVVWLKHNRPDKLEEEEKG
jgi:hypothetical protein